MGLNLGRLRAANCSLALRPVNFVVDLAALYESDQAFSLEFIEAFTDERLDL